MTSTGKNEYLQVFTLEEVARMLRVEVGTLRREAEEGRLHILQIGGEFRVLRNDLNEFLEISRISGNNDESQTSGNSETVSNFRSRVELKSSSQFSHTWPNGRVEEYDEAYEGTLANGKDSRQVRIGFTNRAAAGKLRRRAVIFFDRRPYVEFVGADDFDKSRNMVSVVKRKNGKQIKASSQLPREYRKFRIQPYRDYVDGPYASTNLAVVSKADDLEIMAEHALIRLRYIESRK